MPRRSRRSRTSADSSVSAAVKERKSRRSSRVRIRSRGASLEDPSKIRNTVDIGTSAENDRESLAKIPDIPNDFPDEEEEEEEEDEEEEEEYLGEVEEDEGNELLPVQGVGRPFVYVRIKPVNTFRQNHYKVGDDEKKLKIIMDPTDRLPPKKTGPATAFTFNSDGVLQTSDQEEVFQKTIQDLVEKAMGGISGAVLCMGPELSGKGYTLFGPLEKYEDRGLVPRALEMIFDIVEANENDFEYHIILSMFDIHKDKIQDLLTLGPYELGRVGDFGPKGLFYEEITSLPHGLSLIIRGVTGQDKLHQHYEPCSRYHTIVYVDILCKELRKPQAPDEEAEEEEEIPAPTNPNCDEDLKEWRSRITFAKIASVPLTEKPLLGPKYPPDHCVTGGVRGITCGINWACPGRWCFDDYGQVPIQPRRSRSTSRSKSVPRSCNNGCKEKCCRAPTGNLGEGISIRKDMYFLEQMFIRAHELRKIHDYYNKLQTLGMFMLIPPKLAPSQYFRQSKLTHCLKDIVSGTTVVRLILHIRPERRFLHLSLEAMRFAARARCIPVGKKKREGLDEVDCLTEQKITNLCQELGFQVPRPKPGKERGWGDSNVEEEADAETDDKKFSPEKLKQALAQATGFFEEKLDTLEGACKDQVKSLFETFRESLNHVFDEGQLSKTRIDGEEEEGEEVDVTEGQSGSEAGNQADEETDEGEEHPEEDAEEETEAPGPIDEKSESRQFQELRWNEFTQTEKGSQLVEEFGQKQESLKAVLGEHDEAQKELAEGMGKLTQLELQLDFLEQDGNGKFKEQSMDEKGQLIPSPEELQIMEEIKALSKVEQELMTKLKDIRIQINEGKCHLDFAKRDLEHIFQEFCMETHGKPAELANLPLSTLDHAVATTLRRWSRIQRIKSPRKPDLIEDFDPNSMMGASAKDIAMAKGFRKLKRIAQQQAISLVQAYPRRPRWKSYY